MKAYRLVSFLLKDREEKDLIKGWTNTYNSKSILAKTALNNGYEMPKDI